MYWLFVCNQSDCIGLYVYPVFLEQMPDGLLEIALAAFEVSPDFLWRRCIGYVHRTTVGTHVFHKAFGKICRSAPSDPGRITEGGYFQKEFHKAQV